MTTGRINQVSVDNRSLKKKRRKKCQKNTFLFFLFFVKLASTQKNLQQSRKIQVLVLFSKIRFDCYYPNSRCIYTPPYSLYKNERKKIIFFQLVLCESRCIYSLSLPSLYSFFLD